VESRVQDAQEVGTLDPDEIATALKVLRALAVEPALLAELAAEQRRELLIAAGRVSRPERAARKRLHKTLRKQDRLARRAHDASLVENAGIRAPARSSGFVLPAPSPDVPPVAELKRARACYVCKTPFRRVHHFYHALCPPCAALNYEKRFQTAPLDGRVALVTGARIKIGYQAALLLLRAGATVIATTRFPHDAAQRYAREPDFSRWAGRLHLHGIDLRHVPSVERLTQHLDATLPRLDFLLNNAAQTVRRPPAFYDHLLAGEERATGELPAPLRPLLAGRDTLRDDVVRQIVAPERTLGAASDFPAGWLDADSQQVDLRRVNSWRLTLSEVDTAELLEVHLVNAVAPFLLTARLKPLMMRQRSDDKHVVNVSAMEAQFARNKKTDKHPHTNMAKAALNMMTRTSAVDYAAAGIFMNSVDTGWITDEDPLHHVARKQVVHEFHPPLDALDGAARVCDPIFTGFRTGRHPWGLFFKDYRPTAW
jgi:NAD(P)-dependent dehydrogenase (short-subunit alcohol dehydrogenase family)